MAFAASEGHRMPGSHLLIETLAMPAPVTRILASHADAQLAVLAPQRTCRGTLESALRATLHSGDVGVTLMARRDASQSFRKLPDGHS